MQQFLKIKNDKNFKDYLNLRKEVFVDEQKVSVEEEIDDYDIISHPSCDHFVMYEDNIAICGLRILYFKDYIKIGRVCTKKEYRNKNNMSKLMQFILPELYEKRKKYKYLKLEAQLTAVKLYEKYGFIKYGETFLDAGIEHIKMKRQNVSPFLFSRTNKRYYTVSDYFKTKYDFKVGRVMLDAGFTCPNIDGTVGKGGCTFCSIHGSGDFAGKKTEDLLTQYNKNYERLKQKWPDSKAVAYFQAYSNTYSDLDNLISKFEAFKNIDSCVAIAIGTRPDCLDEEKIKYLAKLNETVAVHLELGLQTTNEETAMLFNRGYENDTFKNTVNLLNKYNIKPIVHIINGLPNDTFEDNINTIKYLNQFKISGIKIHMLHIMHKTKMGKDYLEKPWKLLSKDEYVNTAVEQIKLLNPNVVIHRLTGDAPSTMLIEPQWTIKKTQIVNDIDNLLVKQNAYQGINYES